MDLHSAVEQVHEEADEVEFSNQALETSPEREG